MNFIRSLTNPFTKKTIFPVTKTRAIYDDEGRRLDNYLRELRMTSYNNLLINSNFTNPINQRNFVGGRRTETYSGHIIDRWRLWTECSDYSIKFDNRGMVLKRNSNDSTLDIFQLVYVNDVELLKEKHLTVSIKIDGIIHTVTYYIDKTIDLTVMNQLCNEPVKDIEGNIIAYIRAFTEPQRKDNFQGVNVSFCDNSEHVIEWIKLEYGEVATPYYPRLYQEELELCQWYFQRGIEVLVSRNSTDSYCIYSAARLNKPMRSVPNIVLYSDNKYVNKNKIHCDGDGNSYDCNTDSVTASHFCVKLNDNVTGVANVRWTVYYTADAEL